MSNNSKKGPVTFSFESSSEGEGEDLMEPDSEEEAPEIEDDPETGDEKESDWICDCCGKKRDEFEDKYLWGCQKNLKEVACEKCFLKSECKFCENEACDCDNKERSDESEEAED